MNRKIEQLHKIFMTTLKIKKNHKSIYIETISLSVGTMYAYTVHLVLHPHGIAPTFLKWDSRSLGVGLLYPPTQ